MKTLTVKQQLLAVVLLGVLGWLAYANSFHAEFHFDDYTYIVNKKEIRAIGDWRAVYHALGHPSRFIAFYSFALNYHFHAYDVFGYHLVNWFIHVGNGGLMFCLTWLLLQSPRLGGRLSQRRTYLCALFAGLVFVTHPLQTEAVTYVVQRFTSLAAFFYLAAVVCYLYGRLRAGRAGGVGLVGFALFTVLGMFTKQICFTIPFVIVLIEVCCFQARGIPLLATRWKHLVALTLFLLIIPSFFGFNAGNIIGREFPSRSHTGDTLNTYHYALTQTRVVPTYLRLIVWPAGQTLDYDFHASTSWHEPKVIAGFLFLLGLLGIGAVGFRKEPVVTLATGWFFVTIAVTSSVIPIPHVIFEHRVYLPMAGVALLLSYLICRALRSPVRLALVMAIIVGALTTLTYQRNAVWQTDVSLWQDIIAKAPHKLRAYNNLGMAMLEKGDARQSLIYFDLAIAQNPGAGRVYNNRGMAYLVLGDEDKALADFNRAVELFYGSEAYRRGHFKRVWSEIFLNRGKLRLRRQDSAGAQSDLQEAVRIDPGHAGAFYQLGSLHEINQEFDQAAGYYRKSALADPRAVRPVIGLGYIFQMQGKDRDSVEQFDRALEMDPDNAEALFFRAIGRYNLKDTKGARRDMQAAVNNGFQPATPELMAAREMILGLE
ncbi:MAG: tetratricopeptide repeat protein [Candidatus Omnitrophica bacterium]|nr:tetratricopeptide repeat protein [Candidatus Omnitrophota bacterium]